MALLPLGATDTGPYVSNPVVALNTEGGLPQKSHRDISANVVMKWRSTDTSQ